MDRIRLINKRDTQMLAFWWATTGTVIDPSCLYPPNTSYIYERDGIPLYAVALQVITGIPRAYIEGFIRNPSSPSSKAAVKALQEHLDKEAKRLGITMVFATTKDKAVHSIHKQLGYEPVPLILYNSIRRI